MTGETLESIVQWGDETFGPCEPSRAVSRAFEEWAEMGLEQPGTMEHAIEAADVIIVLLRIPMILEAINAKMAKNRARAWRFMGDGTGYHIPQRPKPTMTDQPTQDAIVTQRDREVLESIDDALGFLMDGERSILLDAIATYRAEIEAATIERCAGVCDGKAKHVGELIAEDGNITDARLGVQMAYECAALAIRNLKGQTS